jgi:hypothetical protein
MAKKYGGRGKGGGFGGKGAGMDPMNRKEGKKVKAYGTHFDPMDKGAMDPMTRAMKMSRDASLKPELYQSDTDYFRRMFGDMVIAQNQAKMLDEHQSDFSAQDRCTACHGTVIELEKIISEHPYHGHRSALVITEALEKVCHLNRYEKNDGVDIRNRIESSRDYGGLAPVHMVQACKQVVDSWQDDEEEIESALKEGGGTKENLYQELREHVRTARPPARPPATRTRVLSHARRPEKV